MTTIRQYKLRIPSPGQEGGGVYWGRWEYASAADFEKVLATAESGQCGSCMIRAYVDKHSFLEIEINVYTGKPTYRVCRVLDVDPHEVSYAEFQRLLKTIETPVQPAALETPTTLQEYKIDQWWVRALRACWGEGTFDNDTRCACKVAEDFAQQVLTPTEFLYRFRSFRRPEDSWAVCCGWSDWEYCTAEKYADIVYHIENSGAAYQAQKIPVIQSEDKCFDMEARGWVEPIYRYRAAGEAGKWAPIAYDVIGKTRNSGWYEFEVSRDAGVTWEHI